MAKQKKQQPETGPFGPIYTQFEKKPKEAILHLKKVQKGECKNALYREETGYVDIVWGEVTNHKTHEGYGLSHIIDKHGEKIKQLGFEIEDFIPIVFALGIYSDSPKENKIRLTGEKFMLVVKTKWDDISKSFVMTTFDVTPSSRRNPKRTKRASKKGT